MHTAIYFVITSFIARSRDSSVGIATGQELDDRDSIPGSGKIFLFSTASEDRF
jgi:hypothetical protein